MQELIEQLKKQVQFIIDKEELKALYGCNDHTEDRMWRSGMREAIKIAESKLPKEEEVIKKCIVMGMEFIPVDPSRYEEDSELIFNETFKTKEK